LSSGNGIGEDCAWKKVQQGKSFVSENPHFQRRTLKKIRNSKTFLFSGKPARQKFQLTFAGKSYKIGVKSKRQVVNAR